MQSIRIDISDISLHKEAAKQLIEFAKNQSKRNEFEELANSTRKSKYFIQ